MKIMNIFFGLILTISLLQCGKREEEPEFNTTFDEKFTLVSLGDKVIHLDSLTAAYNEYHYFFEDLKDKKPYLYLLNRLDKSLQIYDWGKGELMRKIHLEKQGPNGVGNAESIYVLNKDSIYVLASYSFKLSLINQNGKVLKRYSLIFSPTGKEKLGEGIFPSAKQTSSIFKVGNKIIIGGYPFIAVSSKDFYTNGNTSMTVDCLTGKLEYLTSFPKDFITKSDNGFTLVNDQIFPTQTFNYSENKLIINYNTATYIESIDFKTSEKTVYYAGGKNIEKIEWAKRGISDEKQFKHFINQPRYTGIYYDKFRDIYIRTLDIPNPEKVDSYDGKLWTRTILLILDKNFQKVGEVNLPTNFSLTSALISKEGIYLRKYVDDENKIVFTLFKLTEKK